MLQETDNKKWFICKPGIFLFFLSPVIGELLSGSSPPAEFFGFVTLALLTLLYGGGALLIREVTLRWNKGWLTVLLLGIAYAIAEEGLMCKSFFDMNWPDLGVLSAYGRWAGVNWIWSIYLIAFHSIFSILIPIQITNLVFPTYTHRPWINRQSFSIVFILWMLIGVFLFIFISSYRPPLVHFSVTLITMGAFILAARFAPKIIPVHSASNAIGHYACLMTGLLGKTGLFLLVWVSPQTHLHPATTLLLIAGFFAFIAFYILKVLGGKLFVSQLHQLSLISGAIGFFIILSFFQELDKMRLDNTAGMSIVGILVMLTLIWIRRRLLEKDVSNVTKA